MLMIVLGGLVMIGVFVFLCDVTGSWNTVFRRIGALRPPY
jgi:hypothetical protein